LYWYGKLGWQHKIDKQSREKAECFPVSRGCESTEGGVDSSEGGAFGLNARGRPGLREKNASTGDVKRHQKGKERKQHRRYRPGGDFEFCYFRGPAPRRAERTGSIPNSAEKRPIPAKSRPAPVERVDCKKDQACVPD